MDLEKEILELEKQLFETKKALEGPYLQQKEFSDLAMRDDLENLRYLAQKHKNELSEKIKTLEERIKDLKAKKIEEEQKISGKKLLLKEPFQKAGSNNYYRAL